MLKLCSKPPGNSFGVCSVTRFAWYKGSKVKGDLL